MGPDDPIAPLTFAETTTDEDGLFDLNGTPPEMGAYRVDDRAMELMVTGTSGDQAVYYSILADPPATSDATWVSDDTGAALPPLKLQMGAGEVSDQEAAPQLSASGAVISVEEAPEGTVTTPEPLAAGASACKKDFALILVPQDKYKKAMVPVQRLTTKKHSTQRYEYQTTGNTKLQLAVTGAGGNYGGGWAYTKEEGTTLGWKWEQANKMSQTLRPQWEYRQWRAKCYNGRNQAYWLNVWRWFPTRATVGGRIDNSKPTWSCQAKYTVKVPVETWITRTSSVTWSGFFSVAGVSLNDNQTNSSEHKMTIIPDAGEKMPKVCGDTDYPLYANRMQEIR